MAKLNEEVTIDGAVYDFQLLNLKDAMRIESKVIGLIGSVMGKTVVDDDALYNIGVKICKGLLIDGFEVTDIDDYFKGKAMLFNKAIIEGLKVNFPDFFSELENLGSGSAIKRALSDTGINIEA